MRVGLQSSFGDHGRTDERSLAGLLGGNRPQGRIRGNVQIDNEQLKVGNRQPSTEQTARCDPGAKGPLLVAVAAASRCRRCRECGRRLPLHAP